MDIILRHIHKSYGENQVLRDFSHRFEAGKIVCVMGASGCGKTTLLRLIAGLETPDSGLISGVDIKKISAVFQEDRLIENLSAEKNIMLTSRHGFTRQDACLLLQELDLRDCAALPVASLSGGMKRRVTIARALAADYTLLLLDEPLSGLDEEARVLALNVIRRHAEGRTLLCVTHDPQTAARLGARILYLQ